MFINFHGEIRESLMNLKRSLQIYQELCCEVWNLPVLFVALSSPPHVDLLYSIRIIIRIIIQPWNISKMIFPVLQRLIKSKKFYIVDKSAKTIYNGNQIMNHPRLINPQLKNRFLIRIFTFWPKSFIFYFLKHSRKAFLWTPQTSSFPKKKSSSRNYTLKALIS